MQPNVLTMESCSDSFSMVLVQPEDEHKRMESMNGASLVDITQKHSKQSFEQWTSLLRGYVGVLAYTVLASLRHHRSNIKVYSKLLTLYPSASSITSTLTFLCYRVRGLLKHHSYIPFFTHARVKPQSYDVITGGFLIVKADCSI